MKAEGKLLKKPLRIKGETPAQLVNKIVAYNIDKVITFDIPEKKIKATSEEKTIMKKKKKEETQKQDKEDTFLSPIRNKIGKIFIKYRNMIKKNDYKDTVKDIKNRFRDESDEAIEEFEGMQGNDYELPEELFDLIEKEKGEQLNILLDILKRGARGEFTQEFIKKEKEKAAKDRGD